MVEKAVWKLPLSGFLLRRGFTPFTVWSTDAGRDVVLSHRATSGWEHISLDETELLGAAVPGDVVMAVLRRYLDAPIWQRFFRDRLDVADIGGSKESMNAAIFCAVAEDTDDSPARWIVWTFGGASRSLRRFACDPRFGMMAALNLLVDPLLEPGAGGERLLKLGALPRVRQLRYRATAPYVRQSGSRAARDIPIDGFRVDRSSDLISAIGGSNANPALSASSILGGKSLQFRAEVSDLVDLVQLAETAYNWSRQTGYKGLFSWIDNIRPVDDDALVQQLREQLAAELMEDPQRPSIDVLLPDDLLDVGDDRSIQYIALPGERRTEGRTTLPASRLASLVASRTKDSSPSTGLDAELRFLDESQSVIGTATVLVCLAADLIVGTDHYIAYDGDFYLVDHAFVTAIDAELGQIPTSSVDLPAYRGETEPDYNERVAKEHPDTFVLLDTTQLRVPDESGGVEPCDLVHIRGALIHVKRKGKSSKLSHLLLQVANSCELLRRSPEARAQLAQLVDDAAQNPAVAQTIHDVHDEAMQRRNGPEVVFAFLGDWRGKNITSLPLFSRIGLVHEARRVSALGYHAGIKLVPPT